MRRSLLLLATLTLTACGDDTAPPPADVATPAAPATTPPPQPNPNPQAPPGEAAPLPAEGAATGVVTDKGGSVAADGSVVFGYAPAVNDTVYAVSDTEELTAGGATKARTRKLELKVLEQVEGNVERLQVTVGKVTQGAKGEEGTALLPAKSIFVLASRPEGPAEVKDANGGIAGDDVARAVRASVRGFRRPGAFVISLGQEAVKPGAEVTLQPNAVRGMLGEDDAQPTISDAKAKLVKVDGSVPVQRAVFEVAFKVQAKRDGAPLEGDVTGTVIVDVRSGIVVDRTLTLTGKDSTLKVTGHVDLSSAAAATNPGPGAAAGGAKPVDAPKPADGATPAATPKPADAPKPPSP